jgi:hypothetical protein
MCPFGIRVRDGNNREKCERYRGTGHILLAASKKSRCRQQAWNTDNSRESLVCVSGIGFFALLCLAIRVDEAFSLRFRAILRVALSGGPSEDLPIDLLNCPSGLKSVRWVSSWMKGEDVVCAVIHPDRSELLPVFGPLEVRRLG